jgi:electron transfer flavoprotein beta subunit
MDIIVCIRRITQEPQPGQSMLNPLDRNALEEALRLKERLSGKVTALTMDAPPGRRALEEAVAMGAGETMFLCDNAFARADSLATAYALSYGIRSLGHFDLVLCGNESLAGATGQVGPQLAEILGIPHVTSVRKIESTSGNRFLIERALEHGYMKVEVELPAVLSVVKEINSPRLATVWGIMAAAEKEINICTANEIGAEPQNIGAQGSPSCALREFKKTFDRRKEILSGPPEEVVRKAVDRLVELGAI